MTAGPPPDGDGPSAGSRPLIERVGLGLIALVVSALFATITIASLGAGELFLGVMAGIGALMTLWAGASTLRRG